VVAERLTTVAPAGPAKCVAGAAELAPTPLGLTEATRKRGEFELRLGDARTKNVVYYLDWERRAGATSATLEKRTKIGAKVIGGYRDVRGRGTRRMNAPMAGHDRGRKYMVEVGVPLYMWSGKVRPAALQRRLRYGRNRRLAFMAGGYVLGCECAADVGERSP
jgi:hypothetical protein